MTGVLEDAQVYSGHAGKKELDVSDVKLAVQTRVDHSFTNPPPRDVCILKHFVSDYCVFGAHCVLTHCHSCVNQMYPLVWVHLVL